VLGFVGIAVAVAVVDVVDVVAVADVHAVDAGLDARNAAAAAAATSAVVVANLLAGCACSAQRLGSASRIRLACRWGSGLRGMSAVSRFASWSVDCRSCVEVWLSSVLVMADRSTVTLRIGEQRRSSLDSTSREGLEVSWSGPGSCSVAAFAGCCLRREPEAEVHSC
jgi:hypothetical protein